jgi:hypothetical protein
VSIVIGVVDGWRCRRPVSCSELLLTLFRIDLI